VRIVRRLGAALLLSAVLVAGCGGDGAGAGSGGLKALSYFPRDTALVVVVSTDVEGDQFENLDRLVRRLDEDGAEGFLRGLADDLGLSYEDDLKPLLGHELAAGLLDGARFRDEPFDDLIVAFRVADEDKLRELLERDQRAERVGEAEGADLYRLRDFGLTAALDGDVVVYASNEGSLREALARADGDDNLAADFDGAHEDLPGDALVRIYGDVERALPVAGPERAAALRELPWVAALQNAAVAVSFNAEDVTVDLALNTDSDAVEEGDLPFATGEEAPEILNREEGEATGGNRNQSLTTAFLFRVAEAVVPDSRFVRDVHAVEKELGIDFVDEVLRQFNGPSASSVSLDGQTFAARSEVSDPEALKKLLPRLAPHLPRLVQGLEGLQAQGQALLFVAAPDVLVLQAERVEVTQEGDLWRVRGLEGEGPDELWFGVIGDVFAVASTEELARQVAEEETIEVSGARGAAVMRANLNEAAARVLEEADLDDFGRLGEVIAWLEASEERLRGQVRVEVPD
jgi:hypothetical protein